MIKYVMIIPLKKLKKGNNVSYGLTWMFFLSSKNLQRVLATSDFYPKYIELIEIVTVKNIHAKNFSCRNFLPVS